MARVASDAARLGGCALSECGGLEPTPGGGRTTPPPRRMTRRRTPSRHTPSRPPCCHDGTERPMPRPHGATEQNTYYRGKNKRHMLKNILPINAARRMLFLSETPPGRVHDQRIADTTPSPLPAGSQFGAGARTSIHRRTLHRRAQFENWRGMIDLNDCSAIECDQNGSATPHGEYCVTCPHEPITLREEIDSGWTRRAWRSWW